MKRAFPWIAAGLGLTIILILFGSQQQGSDSGQTLPLLTTLLMAEFGFLVNAAAVIFTVRNFRSGRLTKSGMVLLPINLLLAGFLLFRGIQLWPGIAGG